MKGKTGLCLGREKEVTTTPLLRNCDASNERILAKNVSGKSKGEEESERERETRKSQAQKEWQVVWFRREEV